MKIPIIVFIVLCGVSYVIWNYATVLGQRARGAVITFIWILYAIWLFSALGVI